MKMFRTEQQKDFLKAFEYYSHADWKFQIPLVVFKDKNGGLCEEFVQHFFLSDGELYVFLGIRNHTEEWPRQLIWTYDPWGVGYDEITGKQSYVDDRLLTDLQLTVREYNALILNGIKTIEDLKLCTWRQLSQLRNLGKKSIELLRYNLNESRILLRE